MDTPEGWVLLHELANKQKIPLYLKRSAVVAVGQDDVKRTIVVLDGNDGNYVVAETPDEALAAITAGR